MNVQDLRELVVHRAALRIECSRAQDVCVVRTFVRKRRHERIGETAVELLVETSPGERRFTAMELEILTLARVVVVRGNRCTQIGQERRIERIRTDLTGER